MSPRTRAIATYYRAYRRHVLLSTLEPAGTATWDEHLTAATVAYTALQAEKRPRSIDAERKTH